MGADVCVCVCVRLNMGNMCVCASMVAMGGSVGLWHCGRCEYGEYMCVCVCEYVSECCCPSVVENSRRKVVL